MNHKASTQSKHTNTQTHTKWDAGRDELEGRVDKIERKRWRGEWIGTDFWLQTVV